MVRSAILEMSDYSSRRSMRFSTRSEYGIRVMVRLGRGYGQGPIPLAELAELEACRPRTWSRSPASFAALAW